MDGMHDLGGKQGFGPVRYTPNAPSFHAAWELRVNSLYSLAVRQGVFNMDEYRHAIERMEPRHYMGASYYERTLTSLASLLVEKGVMQRDELERRLIEREIDRDANRSTAGASVFVLEVVVGTLLLLGMLLLAARFG